MLIRFVVDPDGRIVVDVENRLPGRGIWLSAARDVVNTVCQKRLFAKAARRGVIVEPDLAAAVEATLVRRCLALVGLARRAGEAEIGFDNVHAALKKNKAALLIEASDGAADGRRKLMALGPDLPVVDLFDSEELGSALGRESLVHIAVAPGRLAQRFLAQTARLAGFRSTRPWRGNGNETANTVRNADG